MEITAKTKQTITKQIKKSCNIKNLCKSSHHSQRHYRIKELKQAAKVIDNESAIMKLGKQLSKLKPSMYDTRCYRNNFHTMLNQQDQAIFNKYKPEISKHLSRTTRFIPTGKKLSKKEIKLSCAKFAFRLVSVFKAHHNQEFMDKCKRRDQQAGIRPWRPKKIKMSTAQLQTSVRQYFKSDAWRSEHSSSCIQLPHLINNKIKSLETSLQAASQIQKVIGIPTTMPIKVIKSEN